MKGDKNRTINYIELPKTVKSSWLTDIHGKPNGTTFLLDGVLCIVCGNMESDENWKFRRMTDCKIFGVKKQPKRDHRGESPTSFLEAYFIKTVRSSDEQ